VAVVEVVEVGVVGEEGMREEEEEGVRVEEEGVEVVVVVVGIFEVNEGPR
jgi:hypothetical protein